MNSNGEPSQTALTAAAARAAHLIVDDEPLIFRDTIAYRLLGDQAETLVGFHRSHGAHPVLAGARTAVVARSRYTENRVEDGLRRGIDQYVILGAGLDSFAYRSSLAGRVRVFEVDHPATQRWKRDLLAVGQIAVPPTLAFVPADFEAESSIVTGLVEKGFDLSRPALVSWLGVTMYLTREAVAETLAMVSGLAAGTEIIVEYLLPERSRDVAGQAYADMVAPVAAEQGEPWLTFFDPEEMSALLQALGFEVIEHVRQCDTVDAALWDRSDALYACDLPVLARARVSGV